MEMVWSEAGLAAGCAIFICYVTVLLTIPVAEWENKRGVFRALWSWLCGQQREEEELQPQPQPQRMQQMQKQIQLLEEEQKEQKLQLQERMEQILQQHQKQQDQEALRRANEALEGQVARLRACSQRDLCSFFDILSRQISYNQTRPVG